MGTGGTDATLGPSNDPDSALPAIDAGMPSAPLIEPEAAMRAADLFIGSGGIGFNHGAMTPAAQRPHGFVRLGPDTTRAGAHPDFHHFSGYHFGDPHVRGFSHTRFVGTGIADFGNLRVLPVARLDTPGYTALDKTTEQARPGRYSARLPDEGVGVELTATGHGGAHRYTFDQGGWLIIDAGSSVTDGGVRAAEIHGEGAEISGAITYAGPMTGRGHGEGFPLAFYGTIDPAPLALERRGEAVLAAQVAPGVTELRIAVSLIDGDQARQNHQDQLADQGFDALVEAAEADWLAIFARLRVAGGEAQDLTTFYTALYHAHAMPTRLDEGGRYRGIDNRLHDLAWGGGYYSDLSLWDTFRTLHPWYTLAEPDLQRDVLRSLHQMAEDGGVMPRWPAATTYGGSMIGTSADHLFAEGLLKGIDGVDYAGAFEHLWAGANGPSQYAGRRSVEAYLELGYVPTDDTGGATSRTLEYAWADASLAGLAAALDQPERTEALAARSGAWRHLLHPETGLLTPKSRAGEWMEIRPTAIHMEGDAPYVEGSAWHWRFYALQDPEGLAAALAEINGEPDALADALDTFFSRSGIGDGPWIPTRPDPYYWHGNEPDLHAPWLYAFTARPESGHRWIRAIQRRAYGLGPDGLPGNDDGGTLSAWLLLSASGLYPIAGTDAYLLSPPLFERVEIHRPDGVITIVAPGASADRWQIEGAQLGDQPIGLGDRLRHEALLQGQPLTFEMAP